MNALATLLLGSGLLAGALLHAKAAEVVDGNDRFATADAGSIAFDLCKLYGNVSLPYSSDNLCSGAGITTPGLLDINCRILGILENEFQGFAKTNASCPAYRQTPAATRSLNGTLLPWVLSDQRPLPTNLPASLISQEGPSIYWHWKNLYNFELWCPCAATNATRTVTNGFVRMVNSSQNWLRPAGWAVVSTLWIKDGPAQAGLYWPFATILHKGSMMVIFIRGTETYQDWLTDFTYDQNPVGNLSFPGGTHAGFANIADQLWQLGVQSALNTYVVNGPVTSVAVSGHSLGAGVATLVSYAAQSYLNQQLRRKKVKVDALLFAPPNAGDSVFAAAFNNMVNGRRISFQYDLIPQVPCTPTMAACSSTVVPNPNPNGTWPYATVGGTMLLQPAGMPQQPQVWALFEKLYPCQVYRFLLATHICAYNCYFTQFVTDTNNMCLMWNATSAGGLGTYCYQYPVTSGEQYPY